MVSFFRKNMAWAAVLLLSLLPIAIWAIISPLNYRFFDLSATMTSLGQLTGLVGMVMFAVSLILGARLKVLGKYFDGLGKVYQNHHIIGAVSFSLLLFHPLFLVVRYIQFSLRDAALFFLPSADWTRNFGIISLVFMIVLMILTFYIQLKYQHWKLSHKFMVLVFVFAILHVYYVSSDVSRDIILRAYIFSLSAIGLAAGFWRSFVVGDLKKDFDYEIVKFTTLGNGILEIEMAPRAEKMKFEAGQFAYFSFEIWGAVSESHPFSISSSPDSDNLKIGVKALGDFTTEMKNLKIGDKVFVEGPYGEFSYKKAPSKNQIWIAGGIGITPFLSMSGDLKPDDGYVVDLYYCTKNREEAVSSDDLLRIDSLNKNFRVFFWCSEEKGYISAQAISDARGGLVDKDIFLCGPPILMVSMSGQFEKMGIAKNRIHWENFGFK